MSESELIKRLRSGVHPLDAAAAGRARERIDRLTKPPGSLGAIEELAVRLCAIAGKLPERPYSSKAILIAAADHGVTDEGVSAYPPEVTSQMVAGILAGDAAVNAFARASGADVYVANFGVREALAPHPLLIDVAVGFGTANFARRAAMRTVDVERALAAGVRAVDDVLARKPYDVLALGEMGIGNTTSAAALVAAFTGAPAAAVVGRGTGIADAVLGRKRRIVGEAVGALDGANWNEIVRAVGGFEIVGLAGAILGAAHRRIPVVLDGFVVAAAALIAHAIEPRALHYCIAGHRSPEPGHRIALEALDMPALLDLDLRLGEGSGAALALPMLEAATRMLLEMKTFEEAGVSDRS
jgi:nicotinate-nucleotide--dimethylbenzimidazole phosphoribosyltransferase